MFHQLLFSLAGLCPPVCLTNADPVTNIQDPNRFFDFFGALGGAATNMLTTLYSDLGIPATLREMNGHSVHAYKLVSAERKVTYVKFEWTSNQGIKNLTVAEAMEVQGKDFNHATRDLYDSINDGKFPTWELRMQVMPSDQMDKLPFDPLDATKRWPESIAPFRAIGKLTLNRVPDNFFQVCVEDGGEGKKREGGRGADRFGTATVTQVGWKAQASGGGGG